MDYEFYEKESKYFIQQAFSLLKRFETKTHSAYTGESYDSALDIAYLRSPYYLKISEHGRLCLINSSKPRYQNIVSHGYNKVKGDQVIHIGKMLSVYMSEIEKQYGDNKNGSKTKSTIVQN